MKPNLHASIGAKIPASFGSRVWVWHLGSANRTYQHQVLNYTSVMGEVGVTHRDERSLCLWAVCRTASFNSTRWSILCPVTGTSWPVPRDDFRCCWLHSLWTCFSHLPGDAYLLTEFLFRLMRVGFCCLWLRMLTLFLCFNPLASPNRRGVQRVVI